MSLLENEDPRIKYTAVGGETEFEFPWLVYTDFDGGSSFLKVVRHRDGEPEELVVTTDYTVEDLDEDAGGHIELVEAAEAGDIFILYRELPIETFFSFAEGGDYFAGNVNKNSNLMLQVMQQLRLQINRAAALAPSELLDSLQLPTPVALKYIGWNAAGTALENKDGTVQGTDETVKVSSNDTTAGYLLAKLLAGAGITLTEGNNGGNETYTVAAVGNMKVSADDTTLGYLNGKLVAGNGITLTEGSGGGNETLTVKAGLGILQAIIASNTNYAAGTNSLDFSGGVQQNTGGYTVNATNISFPAGVHLVTLSPTPDHVGADYGGLISALGANPTISWGFSGAGPNVAPVPCAHDATRFVLPYAEHSLIVNTVAGTTPSLQVVNSLGVTVTLGFRVTIVKLSDTGIA